MNRKKTSPEEAGALVAIGERLAEAREGAGLTRQQLAAFVGINKGTYDRWEQGTSNPSGLQLLRVMVTLGVNPGELLGMSNGSQDKMRKAVKRPTVWQG